MPAPSASVADSSWLDRAVIVGVPLVAIGAAAVVTLGPGAPQPAVGARVWARGAGHEGRAVSLRIETATRWFGTDERVPLEAISVELYEGPSAGATPRARWSGRSEGVVDVTLATDEKLARPFVVVRDLRREGGGLLAEGALALERRAPQPLDASLRGAAQGELEVRAEARGVLAAPFDTVVDVVVTHAGAPSPARLSVRVDGGEATPSQLEADVKGRASFTLRPLAHVATLTLEATHEGRAGTLTAPLSVVPGAFSLRMSAGRLEITSPVVRERAYVSIDDETGRRLGAVVPLAEAPDGFHRGELGLSHAPHGVALTVSSDLAEASAGTTSVALPLGRPGAYRVAPLELAHDGLPGAVSRESARSRSARLVAAAILGLAGLVAGVYVAGKARGVGARGKLVTAGLALFATATFVVLALLALRSRG